MDELRNAAEAKSLAMSKSRGEFQAPCGSHLLTGLWGLFPFLETGNNWFSMDFPCI